LKAAKLLVDAERLLHLDILKDIGALSQLKDDIIYKRTVCRNGNTVLLVFILSFIPHPDLPRDHPERVAYFIVHERFARR
jgi:hypothetical protein